MAGAEVIGAAIAILLLILVGYIMVGSTLSSADIVVSAQKDVALQNEARLITNMDVKPSYSTSTKNLIIKVTNIGSEIIGDFNHIDIFINNPGNIPIRYSYHKTTGTDATKTWTVDRITLIDGTILANHPTLNPGEVLWCKIEGQGTLVPTVNTRILISSSNGALGSGLVIVTA